MERKATQHTLSWFWDLYQRKLLDLDPPYQRKSVWNLEYKEYFIDTVINSYPCPAIFLHEEISEDGVAKYSVIDGKQRLLTLFEFVGDAFTVGETATVVRLRGKYFSDFSKEEKQSFWRYQFSTEYIAKIDENIINDIFNRINKNVAKLTRQELRHARFDGLFISAVDSLADQMMEILPRNFPQIAQRSRQQMKDSEMVATLLLLIEEGPKSYSQDDLDKAFSDREHEWQNAQELVERFKDILVRIKTIADSDLANTIVRSRLRNQTDFYSLFGAINELLVENRLPDPPIAAERLLIFLEYIENEARRASNPILQDYFAAARSASNDAGPRRRRIDVLKTILAEEPNYRDLP